MAVLDNTSREQVWAEFMRKCSLSWEPLNLNKAELRAVVNAVDQWIEDNQASFNSALPEPGKSNLTAAQKVRLFMAVAAKRYEVI